MSRILRRHVPKRFFSEVKGRIVQKYGGTSLGTVEKLNKVLNIVQSFMPEKQPVVVLSAFSAINKEEGTTSLLLNSAHSAIEGKDTWRDTMDKVLALHMNIINDMVAHDADEHARLEEFVRMEVKKVRDFCYCLKIIQELSPKSHDMIIGSGERLAAGVFAGILRSRGTNAEYVNLSKVFNGGIDPRSKGYSFLAKRRLSQLIEPVLAQSKVPVVTGFFGPVSGGIISGVGRGYSDLTASLAAGAIKAEVMQIWKESDGVFTGNPTKIKQATLLPYVTPKEAAELTHFGNEVLHPFTMESALEDNIPIFILNTFKPSSKGTYIATSPHPDIKLPDSGVTAVCSKRGIRLIEVDSTGTLSPHMFLAKLFQLFEKHNIMVDLLNTTVTEVSATINESSNPNLDSFLNELKDLSWVSNGRITTNRAVVSLIGERMKGVRGMAARLFAVLADNNINVDMIVQAVSEVNMSVVVAHEDADLTVEKIHEEFLEKEKLYVQFSGGVYKLKEKDPSPQSTVLDF